MIPECTTCTNCFSFRLGTESTSRVGAPNVGRAGSEKITGPPVAGSATGMIKEKSRVQCETIVKIEDS